MKPTDGLMTLNHYLYKYSTSIYLHNCAYRLSYIFYYLKIITSLGRHDIYVFILIHLDSFKYAH